MNGQYWIGRKAVPDLITTLREVSAHLPCPVA
jgi:hypothetical protein